MKLIQHFDDFLRDTVNLNQARIDRLNNHVEAIEQFVRDSEYKVEIRSFSPQGSWAHRTIIKPQNGKEFDADLVVYVEPVKNGRQRIMLRICMSSSRLLVGTKISLG